MAKARTPEHPIDTAMRAIRKALRDVPEVVYRDRKGVPLGTIAMATHLSLEVTPVLMTLWAAAVDQAEWNLRRTLRRRAGTAAGSARSATRRTTTAAAPVIDPRK